MAEGKDARPIRWRCRSTDLCQVTWEGVAISKDSHGVLSGPCGGTVYTNFSSVFVLAYQIAFLVTGVLCAAFLLALWECHQISKLCYNNTHFLYSLVSYIRQHHILDSLESARWSCSGDLSLEDGTDLQVWKRKFVLMQNFLVIININGSTSYSVSLLRCNTKSCTDTM